MRRCSLYTVYKIIHNSNIIFNVQNQFLVSAAAAAARACDRFTIIILSSSRDGYYFVVAAPYRSRARASPNARAVWYAVSARTRAGRVDYHDAGGGRDSVIESLRAAAAAAASA